MYGQVKLPVVSDPDRQVRPLMSPTPPVDRLRKLTVTVPLGGPSGLLLATVITIDIACPGTAFAGEPVWVIVGTA